jgi:hypothetical protein
MPPEWWDPSEQQKVSAKIADREDNLAKIKPGVRTMFLIFSTRTADRVWELPLYNWFAPVLDPVLRSILGPDSLKNIIRLQLAQMTSGAHIKSHKDTGRWAQKCVAANVLVSTTILSCCCSRSHVPGMCTHGPDLCVMCRAHRIHIVLKTHPAISFFACPLCLSSRDASDDPNCQPPPAGTCVGIDCASDSVFEVWTLLSVMWWCRSVSQISS